MSDERDEYDLVMPFVVVQSAGGKYDDESFVAGFRLGRLDEELSRGTLLTVDETVETDVLAQVDLLAMRHGYTVEPRDTGMDEWTFVIFRKIAS